MCARTRELVGKKVLRSHRAAFIFNTWLFPLETCVKSGSEEEPNTLANGQPCSNHQVKRRREDGFAQAKYFVEVPSNVPEEKCALSMKPRMEIKHMNTGLVQMPSSASVTRMPPHSRLVNS